MKQFASVLKSLEEKIKLLFAKTFENKSKFNIIVDIACIVFFFLAVLSIPLCSFRAGLNKVTWIFTIGFLGCMCLGLLLYYQIRFDVVSISLVIFNIWMLLSTAINGFKGFTITPITMSLTTLILYLYLSQNRKLIPFIIMAIYLSIVLFAFSYIAIYFKELISLDFKRLGSYFGDINDVSIFFGAGFSITFAALLLTKFKIWRFLIEAAMLLIFGICGLSTGSKMFLLIIAATSIIAIVLFLRKLKVKWFVYLLSFGGLLGVAVLILNLPAFATIKLRLLEFTTDASTIERFTMFVDGFYMFLRKPLFGFGIHGFFISSSFGEGWSHNNFSELLSSYGLVGFMLFYTPYIVSLKRIKKTQKSTLKSIINTILVLFICCMFVVALESQKIFAYTIPCVYAFYASEKYFDLNVRDIFKKKENRQIEGANS